ncbi:MULTISPECIES: helix-turn-helix domain-containing protein [Kitasatospora]|uniref:Helix-turn-helix transcriptional regulator n=1 Tax=Kitasatospora cystarginea TaxID=58350 RepID=A0ABP5RPX6_9ACTN
MTSEASPPPMNWRYCGSQIKLWRERAGVSREQLCEEAGYQYETIKSMEQGRRRPTPQLLQVADDLCGARGLLIAATEYLKPEKLPTHVQDFMAAEEDAIAVQAFESLLIPGLLQTEGYARALLGGHCPPPDEDIVEERVAFRLKRQEKLTRRPPALFSFVIYEAALQTGVGGREVMKQQLQHLLTAGELRNLSVQVLPSGSTVHVGLTGPFYLLETSTHEQLAYVEGQQTHAIYSDRKSVNALTQRYGMIRMQAMTVEESARLISKLAEQL